MDRTDLDDEIQFPAGLRVLVVDDDVTCLRVLKAMLLQCRYEGNQLLLNFSFSFLAELLCFEKLLRLLLLSDAFTDLVPFKELGVLFSCF